MTKKIAPALWAGLLAGLACSGVQAEEEGFWYGGSLALTSDYVFRGVTQTDEGPALQGSLDVGLANGVYAGVWASNVDFDAPDGIDLEVDIYVGWTLEFANETWLDLQLVRYLYPGANPGFGINYNEFIAAYGFRNYTATVAYTNDYLRSDESALYYNFGAEFPLGDTEYTLAAAAGFNDISNVTGSDYWDYQVGVSRSWDAITADLSYYDTSGFDEDVQDFLGPEKWADGRVVLTFSWEF
ncbi:TorF family putative porin [Thioalkalivibrio sp. XN8]|uniref:TorF family putative porin n=1 Tax=Thioalkalivibrio sp. XN8 TaxID=2712863 RepID=UPI0013ED398B|nr:TorF family putative porin [Thioalkalivibrio sp. XN8]NGP54089.1 hypothetical protein [Thioalkalivibrio sp. XN8]